MRVQFTTDGGGTEQSRKTEGRGCLDFCCCCYSIYMQRVVESCQGKVKCQHQPQEKVRMESLGPSRIPAAHTQLATRPEASLP